MTEAPESPAIQSAPGVSRASRAAAGARAVSEEDWLQAVLPSGDGAIEAVAPNDALFAAALTGDLAARRAYLERREIRVGDLPPAARTVLYDLAKAEHAEIPRDDLAERTMDSLKFLLLRRNHLWPQQILDDLKQGLRALERQIGKHLALAPFGPGDFAALKLERFRSVAQMSDAADALVGLSSRRAPVEPQIGGPAAVAARVSFSPAYLQGGVPAARRALERCAEFLARYVVVNDFLESRGLRIDGDSIVDVAKHVADPWRTPEHPRIRGLIAIREACLDAASPLHGLDPSYWASWASLQRDPLQAVLDAVDAERRRAIQREKAERIPAQSAAPDLAAVAAPRSEHELRIGAYEELIALYCVDVEHPRKAAQRLANLVYKKLASDVDVRNGLATGEDPYQLASRLYEITADARAEKRRRMEALRSGPLTVPEHAPAVLTPDGSQHVLLYLENHGVSPFKQWLEGVNRAWRPRIDRQIARMEQGLFGDQKKLQHGVYETRLDFGGGFRLYYGLLGDNTVVLLGGGTKSTQSKDVAAAIDLFVGYRRSRREDAGEPGTNGRLDVLGKIMGLKSRDAT